MASLGTFKNCLAVYDKRMERVYRAHQISPRKPRFQGLDTDKFKFGMWSFDGAIFKDLLARSKIDPKQLTQVPFGSHELMINLAT